MTKIIKMHDYVYTIVESLYDGTQLLIGYGKYKPDEE